MNVADADRVHLPVPDCEVNGAADLWDNSPEASDLTVQ